MTRNPARTRPTSKLSHKQQTDNFDSFSGLPALSEMDLYSGDPLEKLRKNCSELDQKLARLAYWHKEIREVMTRLKRASTS